MRSIKFNDEMVRMILSGNKTQTRRPVKPQPNVVHALYGNGKILTNLLFRNGKDVDLIPCPYGKLGDWLWVREDFSFDGDLNVIWMADGTTLDKGITWSPARSMPRSCSRITLEITDIRVQRVQEIDYTDCESEGIDHNGDEKPCRMCFEVLWNSIYAEKGFGWDANPWVWAITFRRM